MDSPPDVATVIAGLTSHNESHRKLAAFHLQSLLVDESFADAFVQGDGMRDLERVIVEENGNTLAYAMGSLAKLLDYDLGWDDVGTEVISRAVEIVVARPLINVLRNALHLLVLVVSRPLAPSGEDSRPSTATSVRSTGFRALKPMLDEHEDFLDCLVDKLSSADHALSGHALQLINSLLHDSILNGGEEDWPRFLRRLQELGIIDGVETLMRGDFVRELAGPVLRFQGLYMLLLQRWRNVMVDLENYEHRKALARIHSASIPAGQRSRPGSSASRVEKQLRGDSVSQTHEESHRWQRLGFETENPADDFDETGFLGLMDLMAYARGHTDAFQRALLEQSVQQPGQRCPLAKASLRTTMILYQHFDVDQDSTRLQGPAISPDDLAQMEWMIQPLILKWDRIHAAALNAFSRLWAAAGARIDEFEKIDDLATILISRAIGGLGRKGSIEEVEAQINQATLTTVRKWQLEDLDQVFDAAWGSDLSKVQDRLHTEAVQFMQEQRIRCLLQGAWFSIISASENESNGRASPMTLAPTVATWRFVRLSPTRRHLHYTSYPRKLDVDPAINDLTQRIDVNDVSSVVSNVTAGKVPDTDSGAGTVTQVTIYGNTSRAVDEETVLLELQTASSVLASEWLDGLLMLLDQQPITADTNKAIGIIENWSLKVRMLNLEWDDVDWERAGEGRPVTIPSREGLDDDYWYDMGEGH